MKLGILVRDALYSWLFASSHLTSSYDDEPVVRVSWGTSDKIIIPSNLTADGIQSNVPSCGTKHPVDANTVIVIPDAYPNLNNKAVYSAKVKNNAEIIMTPNIPINAEPCSDHVNIISSVILGIISDEARLVFFPVLGCINTATDNDIINMLKNLLENVKIWSQSGKNILITMSISLYRQNLSMIALIEQILAYPNVAWDIAAGNSGLNYCSRNIYSLVDKFPNLAVVGRTRLEPKIPNVIASDSNFGPCVFPYGPGDLTFNKKRVWGTSFVKELAAYNAALWHKYPNYLGKQIMQMGKKQLSMLVKANMPDGTSGEAFVMPQGVTCAPIITTNSPTPKIIPTPTKQPTRTTAKPTSKPIIEPTTKPTLQPTAAPTMQNFGNFEFGATGNASAFQFYISDNFCLRIQFEKSNKVGLAIVSLANQCQNVLKNVTMQNPAKQSRRFEIQAVQNNTMLYVFRNKEAKPAQTHTSNGEPIKYISFDGVNSKYQATQCSGIREISETSDMDENQEYTARRARPRIALY